MNEKRYRVINKCPYDIGIFLQNGQAPVVRPGQPVLLTADDIMYVNSQCVTTKVFDAKMLVAYDDDGTELDLEKIGMWVDKDVPQHATDDEVRNILKGTPKKIEAFIADIEDPAELYNICRIAKEMDLVPSKTKILAAKNPDFEW